MTTTTVRPQLESAVDLVPDRGPRAASVVAFGALLARDLTVTRKNLREVVPRTLLQPLLLMFVFTYVFPKIGQGVGGRVGDATGSFSTLLAAGVVGLVIIFQGIQSVALPMVQEFGYTREIEDRVQAPLPIDLVAVEKITSGAIISFFSALVVFPIAAVVPATPVNLEIDWPALITLMPLTCFMAGALGLTFGTRFEPRTVPILFGVIVIPITFLGCIYYSWAALEPIRWLQIAVLLNPLVYVSEGFRAALTPADHMSLWAIYGALLGFTAAFTYLGVMGFRRRVLT
ncbi:MAG TPA: ABC transporter permease [Acidimicrobiia bacterium]